MIAYGRRFNPETPDPNIDIIVNHYYGGDWAERLRQDRLKSKGKRPLVIGEFGLESDPKRVRALLDAVIESDVSGALIWSMYFHHRDGGFWHHGIITQDGAKSFHWPGFETGSKVNEREILIALRDGAFRIRHMPPPPIAAPAPPELLPFTNAAIFSWRGSAGAGPYTIERSANAAGPWTTIAENVSDTVPCYRPLFADSSARPGQLWFYRVIAVNEGGRSDPSNVVGPVKIRRAVLADEMKTFGLTADRSQGVRLVDKDNYHFAEHYYRLSGKDGDWIVYRAPDGLELDSFDLSTWNPAASPGLHLRVSFDGKEWEDIAPDRDVHNYTPYYAKGKWSKIRATKHRLRATNLPQGMHLLKLQWPDAALLDRVELYFRQAKD